MVQEEKKLKFQDKFAVGDIIKAYHFEPTKDRKESYIIGKVIGTSFDGYAVYKVLIVSDIVGGQERSDAFGKTLDIPMEVGFGEFDKRIIKIA